MDAHIRNTLLAVAAALLVFGLVGLSSSQAIAQEPTPQAQSASESDSGFFSDFRIGDAISAASAVGVVVLGFWLFRVQSARMKLLEDKVEIAKDALDEARERCAEELDRERRHNERLRQQHAAAEELLQRRVDDAERKAGIDESGQVSSVRAELPEDVRADLSETVTLLREMRSVRQETSAPSVQTPEDIAREHLNQGNAYFAAADYERAAHEYLRAIETQPNNLTAHLNHSAALWNLTRYEEALAAADRAIELWPNYPEAHNKRGVALMDLERYEEAHSSFEAALQLQPGDPSALFNRACLFSIQQKPDEALDDLKRAVDGDEKYRKMARTDEDFANIRDDPRFQELVREEDGSS